MHKEKKEILRSYIFRGITALCVIAVSVLFYFFMLHLGKIAGFIGKVIDVLQPVIFGIVIAYLVNPIFNLLFGKLAPVFKKGIKSQKAALTLANIISVTVAILVFCIFLVGFVALIVPQFAKSISSIATKLPDTLKAWGEKGQKFIKSDSNLHVIYDNAVKQGEKWVETDLTSFAAKLGSLVANGVLEIANFLKNLIIGIIVAIYVLFSKRTFVNQSRKLCYAVMKESTAQKFFGWISKTHEIFSGFINGKIIDSIIIGIICFVGTYILRIPYAVLISCIVGITNVIPVFGPWIGGIPCTILVLLIDWKKGIYLGIFIILLQMLDGNVIGPKILGSKTGLNNFWVIFAIVLGGGMFGVLGMVLGVPLFALVYHIIASFINNRLVAKNKSVNSEDYYKSNGDLPKSAEDTPETPENGGAEGAEV